jgi:hypothetical protein
MRAEAILSTPRYHALVLFTTIYGIGPFNARKLYDIGLRDIEDLERYFDAPYRSAEIKYGVDDAAAGADSGQQMTINVALSLREDLAQKSASKFNSPIIRTDGDDVCRIPRNEVTEMHKIVTHELEFVQSGCKSMIVGGRATIFLLFFDVLLC